MNCERCEKIGDWTLTVIILLTVAILQAIF